MTATARRGLTHLDVQGAAPGVALASSSTPSFSVTPMRVMPSIGLGAAHGILGAGAGAGAGAAAAQSRRTLAIGGIGLGQVLKTFMTEHSAVPEDLELVNASPTPLPLIEGILGRRGSTRSNSVVDEEEEEDRVAMLDSLLK